jgi:hypothetical protein
MKSISGFNNSSLQGAAGDLSSSLIAINKIGAGADMAKTGFSNDVQFVATTGGTSYVVPPQIIYNQIQYNQFDCIVQKLLTDPNDPSTAEYRLKCVQGLVTFDNYNVDDDGFLTSEEYVWNHRIHNWNVYPTGSLFEDESDTTDTFFDNGYIKLEKNKNYKVFIYKINPTVTDWKPSVSPQIAVIEEGINADTNVKSKYNGGGAMQSYIVSKSDTPVDVASIDPETNEIGTFNAGDLTDAVTFDPDLIQIVKTAGKYPSAMETWLGNLIPAFAKPSTSPTDPTGVDGMNVDSVPFGCGFATNYVIGTVDVPLGGGTGLMVSYSAGEDDCGNGVQNNVVVAYPVGELFGYTANPYVSGLIDPTDFKIENTDDVHPNGPVSFSDTDIKVLGTSVSITTISLDVPTGKTYGNVGFKYFDCARKEIAYIEWKPDSSSAPSGAGRFNIYQINNGPIPFTYKPILIDTIKVETQADAHWDDDNDEWVSPEIIEIDPYWGGAGAYDDDLTTSKHRDNSNQIGGYLPPNPTRTSG